MRAALRWLGRLAPAPAVGVTAALVAPLVMQGGGLVRLLLPAASATVDIGSSDPCVARAERAQRIALRVLARLARLPLPPWRNRCLQRSVVVVLVRSWYGLPGRVVLGVRREAAALVAHAWVEAGDPEPGEAGPYTELLAADGS